MDGRWTIRWVPFNAQTLGGYKVGGTEPWPGEEKVPVVPCDDAAVERAEAAAEKFLAPYSSALSVPIVAEQVVEAVLRAAGETS